MIERRAHARTRTPQRRPTIAKRTHSNPVLMCKVRIAFCLLFAAVFDERKSCPCDFVRFAPRLTGQKVGFAQNSIQLIIAVFDNTIKMD